MMKDVQVAASINAIEAKIDSFRVEMESVNSNINFFKNQIQELYKKPDVPSEFAEFKSVADSFIKDLFSKNISVNSSISGIKISIETIKSMLEQHDLKIRFNETANRILDDEISDVKEELSQKIVSISTVFSNRFDDHVEKQKKQVEFIGAQALAAPKSILESNNSLIDKIELSRLDGSNAILKASNLELAVKLLERKLENLTLQVKKIELTQLA